MDLVLVLMIKCVNVILDCLILVIGSEGIFIFTVQHTYYDYFMGKRAACRMLMTAVDNPAGIISSDIIIAMMMIVSPDILV